MAMRCADISPRPVSSHSFLTPLPFPITLMQYTEANPKTCSTLLLFPEIIELHRGEAALRINCDTLDTFRTKECKEIMETVKLTIFSLR